MEARRRAGSRGSSDPHPQELGGAVEPQGDPDDERHEPPIRIHEQLRLDEANVPPRVRSVQPPAATTFFTHWTG
jgi:hypothetical protein